MSDEEKLLTNMFGYYMSNSRQLNVTSANQLCHLSVMSRTLNVTWTIVVR